MATEEQTESVRQMIGRFYAAGNVKPPTELQINERVAAVFGIMMNEAAKCSDALNLVPRPPLGVASIGWLASQAVRAAFGAARARLSMTCVRKTIANWQSTLVDASNNASGRRILPRWAA
jgi:hypothetical protein